MKNILSLLLILCIISCLVGCTDTNNSTTDHVENTVYIEKQKDTADLKNVDIQYTLNTSSMKFHYPSCASAKRISDKNRATYTGNRQDLINDGYSPCGNCDP